MSVLCRHFGTCGGCATQDLDEAPYRALKRGMVVQALQRHGVEAEVCEVVAVPPGTRRRCVFKLKEGRVGFHARAAHDIVDLFECRVLTPGLTRLAQRLRMIAPEIGTAEAHATEADNGFDLMLRWNRRSAPVARLAEWARASDVVRITAGNDILVERAAPVLRIAGSELRLPPGAFLQPTREGEKLLQDETRRLLSGAKTVVDLFAGCGTFALALAPEARMHAVEQDGSMLAALSAAARATRGLKPVTAEKRDLFKHPLSAPELRAFDGAVLDPPRAGAAAQAAVLSRAGPARIVYVSCNAQSFARDARVLMDAGYLIGNVIPVDQFLWAEHIELVASFMRR